MQTGTLPWSPEVRAMLQPATTFVGLVGAGSSKASLLGRPLLMLFLLGCAVSAMASGRFSVRLIADGAVSFAFVPAMEAGALAAVFWIGSGRRLRFARTVDIFFVGNGPWLLWLVLIAAVASVGPPTALGDWTVPVLLATAGPLAWSACIDYHFFQQVMGKSRSSAVNCLLLHRAIGWAGAMLYFIGYAKLTQRFGELVSGIGL